MTEPATAKSRPASASAPAAASPAAEIEPGMAQGDVEYLLQQAERALASVNEPVGAPRGIAGEAVSRCTDFSGAPPSDEAATLALVRDVELNVKIELGRTQMYLEDVLKLHRGSVVAHRQAGRRPGGHLRQRAIDCRGEVLVLNDNFCVRIAELIAGDRAG